MAVFAYAAKSLSGQEQKGSREARDKFELARSLREEGYVLISAKEEKSRISLAIPSFFRRVSVSERMIFARNLAVMVAAGLPLSRSLEILAQESGNVTLKKTILSLAASIKKGSNFSESLKEFPNIFSSLFVAMVASGERSGTLEEALKLISHQLKREYDLRRKIRGAMIYPAVIILAMIAIGILMMTFVVPTLVSTFEELDIELPLLTRIVIGASKFLIDYYILAIFIFILFVSGIYAWSRSAGGRRIIDAVLLKIPIIASLVRKNNAARTCRTLGSLVGSGVEILEALSITHDVLQNHYYKNILVQARVSVEKGEPVSKTFIAQKKLYPSLVGEMMAIGEETGKLSEMLFRLAVFYESEVGQATKDLSTIIEPVLMIIIGAVVGLFAVSMIQPLYGVVGSF